MFTEHSATAFFKFSALFQETLSKNSSGLQQKFLGSVYIVLQVIMKLRTNALSWNPMEAFTLTAANEDGKCVVKVDSVGVGVFKCVVWVLHRLKFTVQVCMVLGATVVRVYSAGVCGFG